MGSTSTHPNHELVVGALTALLAGDLDTFFARVSPDVEVLEPPYLPYGRPYKGHAGFRELLEEVGKVLKLDSITLVSATADDERCVLLMTARLQSNDEERYLTEHWHVDNGKISQLRVFWFSLPS